MTRYYTRMSAKLGAEIVAEQIRVQTGCAQRMNLPEGWKVARFIRFHNKHWIDVEVEDDEADPSLEGKTVQPWFQTTVDGGCVIVEREVMEFEHNQVRVEQPELEAG